MSKLNDLKSALETAAKRRDELAAAAEAAAKRAAEAGTAFAAGEGDWSTVTKAREADEQARLIAGHAAARAEAAAAALAAAERESNETRYADAIERASDASLRGALEKPIGAARTAFAALLSAAAEIERVATEHRSAAEEAQAIGASLGFDADADLRRPYLGKGEDVSLGARGASLIGKIVGARLAEAGIDAERTRALFELIRPVSRDRLLDHAYDGQPTAVDFFLEGKGATSPRGLLARAKAAVFS